MFDLASIARAKCANLASIVEEYDRLKHVASTGGGEYAGPCPFCGGKDRFHVQPNHERGGRWLCRGCTGGKWQDAIAYVMRRESVGFAEACRRLAGPGLMPVGFHTRNTTPRQLPRESDSGRSQKSYPPETWQEQARKFVQDCERVLWTGAGDKARNWLLGRGLREDTLRSWHIGFNPEEKFETLTLWGLSEIQDGKKHSVWLPVGVIIPCEIDGKFWYVKIRRAKGDPKYIGIKGGTPALFGAHTLSGHDTGVLCEGEFDCILLNQEAGDLVGTATLGSASSTDIDLRIWGKYLLPVATFLIGYDTDTAGEKGALGLCALSARMRQIAVPKINAGDKDLTDYFKSGGRLRDWLAFELSRHAQRTESETKPVTLEDPALLHRKFLNEIVVAIQGHERESGRTWAEMILAVQDSSPPLAQAYYAAYEKADCDIYGRWQSGTMTNEDLRQFQADLKNWHKAVLELINFHARLRANDNPEPR